MAEYDPGNIFARIVRAEVPSERVYEDEEFIAFKDIAPKAPVHILVIPRRQATPTDPRAYRWPCRLPRPNGNSDTCLLYTSPSPRD